MAYTYIFEVAKNFISQLYFDVVDVLYLSVMYQVIEVEFIRYFRICSKGETYIYTCSWMNDLDNLLLS